MRVASSVAEVPGLYKPCLAIGFFDGVHLGHQQIIRQAVTDARQHNTAAVVLTFDVHPATVVAPDRVPALIQTREHRVRSIAALGPDVLLLMPFTLEFSRRPADEFIRSLHRDLRGIHSICIGANFHFGHRRGGNLEVLQTLGAELGFTVHGLASVGLDGTAISSTRIRDAIRAGQLDAASQMLGRPWSVAGKVMHGQARGQTLGFPTANLEAGGLALPPLGVYAAQVLHQGRTHPAVVNLGLRPTVTPAASVPVLEAHLLDFSGGLYGEELEVVFIKHLRGEQRFPDIEALRNQIGRDAEAARRLLF